MKTEAELLAEILAAISTLNSQSRDGVVDKDTAAQIGTIDMPITPLRELCAATPGKDYPPERVREIVGIRAANELAILNHPPGTAAEAFEAAKQDVQLMQEAMIILMTKEEIEGNAGELTLLLNIHGMEKQAQYMALAALQDKRKIPLDTITPDSIEPPDWNHICKAVGSVRGVPL